MDDKSSNKTVEMDGLPFNLEGGFGGVDATQAIFEPRAIRTNLFEFGTDGGVRDIRWQSAPGSTDQFAMARVRVPWFLDFSWSTHDLSYSVAGETKASFQKSLSNSATSGFSIEGFGAEFSRSFNESTFSETYAKYAVHYQRTRIYTVEFNESPEKYLSARARDDMTKLTAAQIVDKYGTHYMHAATFGGLKVYSSKLDIRDDVKSEQLTQAMDLSVSVIDPDTGQTDSGKMGGTSGDATVQKLHEKMRVSWAATIGGSPGVKSAEWSHSLFTNPAVIGYELKPISALVPARSAEIDEECKRRFEAQKVRESHSLLAMMVPLQAYDTDKGSGSNRDLSVARPQNIRGWFYTGQWGLATSDTFPSGYYALVFRPVPGAGGNPAIVSCGGFDRKWGKSHSYGLYTPRARDGYTAIGDVYEHTDNPDEIQNGDFYGVVRNDLLITSQWQGLLWNDKGSGARDDGSAFKFSNYDSRDTPDDQHMIQVPGGKPEARMFKAFGNYNDPPSGTPMKLDWSHIQVVSNNFIFQN